MLEVLIVSDGENEHEQPQSNVQKTGHPEDPICQHYTTVGDWNPSTKRRRARCSLELEGEVDKLRTHVTLKSPKCTPEIRHAAQSS